MIELQRGFEEIAENYRMARVIIDRMGKSNPKRTEMRHYTHGRISISASTENYLLTIEFDNTENTGLDHWAECLNVTSIGSIHRLRNPHISMKESGEGRSGLQYLPWTVFLKREYDRAIAHEEARS